MKTDEQIEEEFEELVRSGLTDEQFNEWILGWIDLEEIVKRALDWDIETKKYELEQLKKRYNLDSGDISRMKDDERTEAQIEDYLLEQAREGNLE